MNPAAPLDNVILAKNDNNTIDAGFFITNLSSTPNVGAAGLRFVVERATTNMVVGAASPSNNVWTHVVIVFNGVLTASQQKIYYNGVEQPLTSTVDGSGHKVATRQKRSSLD